MDVLIYKVKFYWKQYMSNGQTYFMIADRHGLIYSMIVFILKGGLSYRWGWLGDYCFRCEGAYDEKLFRKFDCFAYKVRKMGERSLARAKITPFTFDLPKYLQPLSITENLWRGRLTPTQIVYSANYLSYPNHLRWIHFSAFTL